MSNETDEALAAIEQEAEKRRNAVREKLKKAPPKIIKSIVKSEVFLTMNPRLLPLRLVDPNKLSQILKDKYMLSFDPPDYDAETIQRLGIDPRTLSDENLLAITLRPPHSQANFKDGRFPASPRDFVDINRLGFSRENILVDVAGRTDVAEVVIAEVFEILWEASGVIKPWDSPEVQDNIQLKAYGTQTKVALGADANTLINNLVVKYLDESINKGKKFGASMGSYSSYDDFEADQTKTCVWTLDELKIKVHCLSQITGRLETADICFNVTTKDEQGRGIVDVSTQLPFDIHVRFVQDLVTSLKKET